MIFTKENVEVSMSNLEPLTDETIESFFQSTEIPVFVDFWALSCKPCIKIEPTLKELADIYKDKMLFVKLNVDENLRSAEKFNIMSLPTFLIMNSSFDILGKIIGAVSKQKLVDKINTILEKS